MTILIPVNNCEQTVRDLSSEKEIDNALSVFNEKVLKQRFTEVDVSPSAWNKRHGIIKTECKVVTSQAFWLFTKNSCTWLNIKTFLW